MAQGASVRGHGVARPGTFMRWASLWAGLLLFLTPGLAAAQDAAEAQELLDKARKTVEDFKADPDIPWFRDHVPDAKAVMVVPVLIKGGFIIGGSGGHGARAGAAAHRARPPDPARDRRVAGGGPRRRRQA